MTVDAGAAPCVHRGLLSLAICKPTIRKVAQEGDVIFGFTANSLDRRNRLIYAARITKKLSNGRYYRERKYAGRGDCIYQYQSGRFLRRKDAKHHDRPQDLLHDLGPYPEFARANVLLSADFRYYGATGTDEYRSNFPTIARAIEALGRGHRVRFGVRLQEELLKLQRQLWRKTSRKMLGLPTKAPSRGYCYRGGRWNIAC